MKICDLSSSSGRIRRATTRLKDTWGDTKELWNDATRNEFEETHLAPLQPHLTMLTAVMTRFASVIEKVEKELADEGRETR
jgi:hypothetical protein